MEYAVANKYAHDTSNDTPDTFSNGYTSISEHEEYQNHHYISNESSAEKIDKRTGSVRSKNSPPIKHKRKAIARDEL